TRSGTRVGRTGRARRLRCPPVARRGRGAPGARPRDPADPAGATWRYGRRSPLGRSPRLRSGPSHATNVRLLRFWPGSAPWCRGLHSVRPGCVAPGSTRARTDDQMTPLLQASWAAAVTLALYAFYCFWEAGRADLAHGFRHLAADRPGSGG